MKSKHNPSLNHSPSNYEQIISDLNKGASFLDLSDIYLTKEQLNDLAEKIEGNSFIGHIIWGPLPNESRGVVEQIENKLIENNKSYKSHPTDFVHGLLSSHSYQNSIEGNKVEFTVNSKGIPHVNAKYNQHLSDWRVEKVFQPENSDDYYSVLYVNDKTHHAVLAHRGTDIPNSLKGKNASLKADLIEILNHNIGVQQAASYVSTKEALEITQQLGYNFSTTGHSLGAWLAELSLYFCHMDFEYHQVKTVTFDSPGSKDQMDVFKSNVDNTETKIRTNQFDMVTYLSAPNIVNVCNQHVGTVYRIAPEIEYPEALKKELPAMLPKFVKNIIGQNKYYLDSLLSVSGHSLSPMLDMFDPVTGKPYPDKYAVVLDWPHIKHVTTTQPSLGVCKFALDKTPFIGSLPDALKNVTVNAVNKLFPRSIATLNSVSTVIASFLSGDTAISQLCETFRHFDLNTHDKGYLPKDLPSLDQFALSYEGHYKTRGVNLLQDKLLTKYKGSIDWYLSQVAKTNAAILEKGLDEVSSKQLSIIKHGFKTGHINGKNHVSLINQHQHNIKSIEQFKGYFARLIEVNPEIRDLLKDQSALHVKIAHSSEGAIANNLTTRVSNFIGRSDIFSKIDHVLKDNQIVAINAFAGTGKSSTALEYGHLQSETGKIVRWFDSDSADKVKANYKQLALDLGINISQEEESRGDPAQEQRTLINSVNNAITKLGKPMLFILDNLENYQDAKEYLANLPKKWVKVIITTRDNNILNNNKQHLTLEPFSNEDAIRYVSTSLGERVDNKTTRDLIRLLGNKEGEVLPYRLSKAVGFLQENKFWSVPKYIDYIKNHSSEQAETALLIESLKASPIEKLILQYAAFLDPDSMSIEIFKELLQLDEEQLQTHITKLEKLSLVSLHYNEGNAYLKMHRLAQDEIIKYINSNQNQEQQELLTLKEIQQNLIISLNKLMPSKMYEDKNLQSVILVYPHVQKILDNSENVILLEKARLYKKLGYCYKYDNPQALVYHLEALKIYQEIHRESPNNLKIADSLKMIGMIYYKTNNLKQALEYEQQALDIYIKLYEDKGGNMASFSLLESQYKELEEMKLKVQNITRSKTQYNMNDLVKIHSSLKAASNAISNIYSTNKLLQKIAYSFHSIGTVYNKLEESDEALKYQKTALTIKKVIYPHNHYEIACSLESIGEVYENLGQIENSLEYHKQSLEMRQKLYQGNHPDIAKSLENLGRVHHNIALSLDGEIDQKIEEWEKALKYKEQALEIRMELVDEQRDSQIALATSYNNIGETAIYLYEERFKTLLYFELALKMRQKLYQGNHPDIIDSLQNVGSVYENILSDKIKAAELYKQSYFMCLKLFGKEHVQTERAMNYVTSVEPKFSAINETRTNILDRSIISPHIILVKNQIQKNILNKIHQLAAKSDWSSGAFISKPSILGDWGIKGYLSEKYLQKMLGKLANPENIKIAQMLCFEAMCLGVMNSKNKDMTCVKEFAKAYPELMAQIIAEHPEYMVDGSIVKLCVKDTGTLTTLLGESENFSGQGNLDYEAADPWMEYTKEGMDELLKLRLEAADQMNVKTIMPNYVYDGSEESAQKLANEISNSLEEKTLVVLNLSGLHWVGLVIEKGAKVIDIQYMDSEQRMMPPLLQEALISQVAQDFPQHNIQLTHHDSEPQKYNNCGSEVIENITSLLVGGGRTTSQEDAVAIHSALLEDSLMSYGVVPYNSTHSHLLLENT